MFHIVLLVFRDGEDCYIRQFVHLIERRRRLLSISSRTCHLVAWLSVTVNEVDRVQTVLCVLDTLMDNI